MPNELKNPFSATTSLSSDPSRDFDKTKSRIKSGGFTATVWTMAGMVLAACGGGTRYLEVPGEGSGIDGGGTVVVPTGNSVFVVDGPVEGAKIIIDGQVVGVTNAKGEAVIDSDYEGRAFTVDLEGSRDVYTDRDLSGTFQSLANGGLASPLTTIVAERAAAQGLSEEDALDAIINEIFNDDHDGDGEFDTDYSELLSVADITTLGNYTRPYNAGNRFESKEGDEGFVADVVTLLSLGLTEYWEKNSDLDAEGDLDPSNDYDGTAIETLSNLARLLDGQALTEDPDNPLPPFVQAIKDLVDSANITPAAGGDP